jgi:phospholipid/cholesterol/gamma-HCH transport system substrate-binding protein
MKQSSVDREMTMELIVGTFMFMVLLALAYFTIVLGRASFFEKKFPLEVEFEDVMGLRKDDNVVQRGMTIGKVKSLKLIEGKVRVLAMLDSSLTLKTDYKITVISTSILGGRNMEVKVGSEQAPPLPHDMMPQGTKPFDLMAEAAEAVHEIRLSMNQGGILTNLEQSVASIKDISGKISRGEGTIGKLVNDEGVYNEFQSVAKEIRGVVARVQEITDKISKGEGTLGKLISDDSVYTNVAAVAANLKDISDRLNKGEGTLGKLLAKDDQLYKDISTTASSLKDITGKIERGEGLLGKLINDETLYNDVKSAVNEFRTTVDDYRETSPVVSFTTLLMGAF